MKDIKAVYNQKVERLREFFKGAGATRAVVALSGGIDSAVVVPLAVAALGKENVRVLMLPSKFSSDHSVNDSLQMVERLGILGEIVSIEKMYDAGMEAITPLFGLENIQLTSENMQARIRCTLTMALCNATGALMLNTSNRSEILVGYGTLYGDTSGAVAVIGNLYKDEVYALARYINEVQGEVIPVNIIDKAPSAELAEGQRDSDSLPEYPILDPVLRALKDEGLSAEQVAERGFDIEVVRRVESLCARSAFKAKQLPPLL